MIRAIFSEDGLRAAFYDTDVHSVVPDEAVEISRADWWEFLENPGQRRWIGTSIELYEAPILIDLPAYARDVSWRTRCAGTTILGFAVKIDDGSIGLINGMANLAQRDPARVFAFDSPDGTVHLTGEQAIAFAEAVGEWVQLTFDRRALVLAAIAAGTITTTEQIDEAFVDVTAAWP